MAVTQKRSPEALAGGWREDTVSEMISGHWKAGEESEAWLPRGALRVQAGLRCCLQPLPPEPKKKGAGEALLQSFPSGPGAMGNSVP